MHITSLLVLTGALALSACTSNTIPSSTINTQTSSVISQSDSTGFESLLNNFRASQGRGAVQRNAKLDRAAAAHASDMLNRSYFSHQSPGGPNGDTFDERIHRAGCRSSSSAENIAWGQRSETAVQEAWKKSAGHRRNMLVGDFTQFGLGRSGNHWVLLLSTDC
jgi:uncharacterized protein YkwD